MWNTKNPVEFAEKKLGIKLDEWQRDYIKTEGNVAIRAARQSGKSFAQSLRVALFALLNKGTQTLIIGAVDRQSVGLFEKVKSHITNLAKWNIKGKPTMHKIELTNGSKIIAEPAGRTGYGLRFLTIHKLVCDEAHYIPEEVFIAVRPMLATTDGTIDLLSTPKGNKGYFYDAFEDEETKKDFKQFHVRWQDCPRHSESFIKRERRTMTKLQFAQEYDAVFLDSLQAFFTLELINNCIKIQRNQEKGNLFLGVDLAGYGGDENAFVNLKEIEKKKLEVLDNIETTEKVSAHETVKKISDLNKTWNYKKIGLDDGGIGTPILDFCLEDPKLKRKTVGINNASRSIEHSKKGKKKLLKEDLYGNLKILMEQKFIKLPNNPKLKQSLLSIQYEIDEVTGNIKIFGKYSHITEALIRAAWCAKTKGLNIRAFC